MVVFQTVERGTTVLSDSYDIKRRPLGWGTYGEVNIATHRATGAKRAVKNVCKARLNQSVNNVRAWVRHEAEVLRVLDHPNIVRIHETFDDPANMCLVMELCEGGNLTNYVEQCDGSRMDEALGAKVFMQIVAAVRHIHTRGFVHRDLKLDNVIFAKPIMPVQAGIDSMDQVEQVCVKLTDFGLACRPRLTAGVHLKDTAGTPDYMAPEAKVGKVSVPFADRSDMWSLGVVLNRMLTGRLPPPPGDELEHSLPPFARDLLEQLLNPEPESRPSAATVLRHAWLDNHKTGSAIWAGMPVLSLAIRAFATAPRFRRLALVAVARETSENDLGCLRQLFDDIELDVNGVMHRHGFEQAVQTQGQAASTVLTDLVRHFEAVDVDGSGTIDWTELVAVVLGAAAASDGISETAAGAAKDNPKNGEVRTGDSFLPRVTHDACARAFNLLSQGGGFLTAATLGQLFAPAELRRWMAKTGAASRHGGHKGSGVGSSVHAAAMPHARASASQGLSMPSVSERPSANKSSAIPRFQSTGGGRTRSANGASSGGTSTLDSLDGMVKEYDQGGSIKFKTFLAILKGADASGHAESDASLTAA
jgi:calcium-dependent protein kinase